MRLRNAKRLANRDQVEVRIDGNWLRGYVLGEPRMEHGVLLIPVMGDQHTVTHLDVR